MFLSPDRGQNGSNRACALLLASSPPPAMEWSRKLPTARIPIPWSHSSAGQSVRLITVRPAVQARVGPHAPMRMAIIAAINSQKYTPIAQHPKTLVWGPAKCVGHLCQSRDCSLGAARSRKAFASSCRVGACPRLSSEWPKSGCGVHHALLLSPPLCGCQRVS